MCLPKMRIEIFFYSSCQGPARDDTIDWLSYVLSKFDFALSQLKDLFDEDVFIWGSLSLNNNNNNKSSILPLECEGVEDYTKKLVK